MATISLLEAKLKRLNREIQQLEQRKSRAVKEESNSLKKINRANDAIRRTKNSTTIRNKEREILRENEKVQKAKEKQSSLSSKITKKSTELSKAMSDLNNARQREQNKLFEKQEKQLDEYKANQAQAVERIAQDVSNIQVNNQPKEYDVFISHSADDKDSFVDDLASALKEANISIWYDNDSIGWGKSIRQEIDKGLTHSKYGIVVISPTFIKKYWTNYELNGILSKEGSSGTQMILPIWHNITADEVKKYSHSLSNLLALNTAFNPIDEIVENVKKIVK
ncbi:TIR domain-containing protein [Cerasibacillus sp. JNUCC 74]